MKSRLGTRLQFVQWLHRKDLTYTAYSKLSVQAKAALQREYKGKA